MPPNSQATAFAPILLQGDENLGQVQAFLMEQVSVRTNHIVWQQAGWSGQGVKVGVLDRGFGQLNMFEELANTIVSIPPAESRSDYQDNSIIHGTQVLETIWSVAPEVEFFACEYNSYDKYVQCIDWMIASEVNIINHSAGVPALPLDGSSQWSRQVDRVARENILWVNSAGNFADGYYPGVLTDSNANTLHEFRGNSEVVEALGVNPIRNGGSGVIMLSWTGKNGQVANTFDIDLQIVDARTGNIISGSYDTQNGLPVEQALEYLVFDMSRPFAVQIIDRSGTSAGVDFALFVEFSNLPNGESQQSIIAPGDSSNSLTIGAMQGQGLAPYSSRGPLATDAMKPDLVAPGEVLLSNGTNFVGTSAAAPVVAGSAALIWQAFPDFDANDVRIFIINATQDDNELPGNDVRFGNGRLYMPLPVSTPEFVVVTEQASPTSEPLSTNTPTTEIPTAEPSPTIQITDTPIPPQSAQITTDGTLTVTVETANLRSGPGTNYNIAGSAVSGTVLDIIARTGDSDWYLIEKPDGNPAWIWSGIVDVSGSNSQIEVAATIPATPETAIELSSVSCAEEVGNLQIGMSSVVDWDVPNSPVAIYSDFGSTQSGYFVIKGAVVQIVGGPFCDMDGMQNDYWQVIADPNYPANEGNVWIPGDTGHIWTSQARASNAITGYILAQFLYG
ncbi:MAG: hypothetical protein Phog2KO_30310 [Phototrophicaceae bacterium]